MNKYLIALLVMLLPSFAYAEVKINITAEKEIVVTKDGKEVVKRVAANEAVPGDIIFYTVAFENTGKEAVADVDVVDPIPQGVVYINGSVFGSGSEITFSIDSGKTYKQASLLTYKVNGGKRVASPESYSHIRWKVKSLGAGKNGVAGFKARVK
ncbi:MAG: hypothetical protein R8M46_05420 [Ghiorsea sp.]